MNQSTVSYWLDQLRTRTGDPLFVRAGNGVQPTERAKVLLPEAEAALRHLDAMFATPDYDPKTDVGTFRIAATAVERNILLAPFLQHVLTQAPNLTIDFVQTGSHFQTVQALQNGTIDLCFMPPSDTATDGIMQRKLIQFRETVFFDPAYPLEEGNLDAFCARPQARIALGPDTSFTIDRRLAKMGRKRKIALQVPDFDSALALIKNSDLIVTLPDILPAPDLCTVNPPWPTSPIDIGMFWHARSQTSERHRYWRKVISKLR